MKKHIQIALITLLIALFGVGFGLWIAFNRVEARTRARGEVLAIKYAIEGYYKENKEPLDPAEVFKILSGHNPKHVTYLVTNSNPRLTQGKYLDPWGEPYRFDLTDRDHPIVISFGSDGRRSPDDITSNWANKTNQ